MKSILNFSKTVIAAALLFLIAACEKEDFLVFTATTDGTLSFQNEIQPVYKLSNATSSNIAERLVWNAPDFEAPTTVTYLVELSTAKSFATIIHIHPCFVLVRTIVVNSYYTVHIGAYKQKRGLNYLRAYLSFLDS